MEFKNTPPKWNATGAEPSEELQANGFLAGYKPPAAFFNYLFHNYTECIEELQSFLVAIGNGTEIVEKANADGNGDNIANTYAKKTTVNALGHKFTINGNIEDMDKVAAYTAGIVYAGANGLPADFTNGYGIVYTLGYSDIYQLQRIMRPNGNIYERICANNVFYDWAEVFTSKKPPTYSQVGAAAADTHNLKTYITLEQLGLTVGSETIETIFTAMPNFSYLQIATTSQNNMSIYPSEYGGTLIVEKSYGNRARFTYFAQNKEWVGHYFNSSWYGWTDNKTIRVGTAAPDNSVGVNGDIYIQIMS